MITQTATNSAMKQKQKLSVSLMKKTKTLFVLHVTLYVFALAYGTNKENTTRPLTYHHVTDHIMPSRNTTCLKNVKEYILIPKSHKAKYPKLYQPPELWHSALPLSPE